MAEVTFRYQDQRVALEPRSLKGHERLGEATRLSLELFADEPVELEELVGRACAVGMGSELGERVIHAVVIEAVALATSQAREGRRYRLVVESAIAVLGLRRRCRVFQELSVVDIVTLVLGEGGIGSPKRELSAEHAPRRYLTQYHESDAELVRRICEEEGIWWRVDPGEEQGSYVVTDDVALAPVAGELKLGEEAGLGASEERAWGVRAERRRATGAVTERDYAFRNPALAIEGREGRGTDHEQAYEVYRAPDRAVTPAEAGARARFELESLRAEAETLCFETSAFTLWPGVRVPIDTTADYAGMTEVATELFVVALDHEWRHGEAYRCRVTATPSSLPYRLPRRSRRPKISGLHSAWVTGPPGEEIFTDADGCVRVKLSWDREGPGDQGSSLPVRVLQPNLQGSMLIPRIGWEVWVAFEDGDPDRPYVLGRAFNGRHRPPVPLPANKTMTSLSTSSSPGAGCLNYLRYEDGAGRQGLSWHAGRDMLRNVGNDMASQTVADEKITVKGTQVIDVGGNQTESVTGSRVNDVDVQNVKVGAMQELKTPQAMHVKIGSETVAVGGALMEYVGSPADALADAAVAALLGVGGLIPGNVANYVVAAGGAAYSAYKASQESGDFTGALADEVNKFLIGKIPGGDSFNDIVDVVDASRKAAGKDGLLPSYQRDKAHKAFGQEEDSTVGGTGGAGGGGPGGGGSGHRIHDVGGMTVEAIGGLSTVSTPATSKWTTLGASTILVGGTHTTLAGKVSWTTAGASVHTTGAYSVTASGSIVRDVRWLGSALGGYTSSAGAGNIVRAKSSLTLNCGPLSISGTVLFDVNGTQVIVDGGSITVKGAEVTIDGPSTVAELDRS